MTQPRYSIINNDEIGTYHCFSRCVQRAYLCGVDNLTGQDYSHRKGWMLDRMKDLSQIFFIDTGSYALMSNHFHIILRNRPDLALNATAADIVTRWYHLFPKQRDKQGKVVLPTPEEMDALISDVDRVAVWRKRLSSISWYMRSLKQPIARRANEESETTGRFWEGRFKAIALLDDAAILSCAAYVELNPIRAKVAQTPENSDYTSANSRILGRQARKKVASLVAQSNHQIPPELLALAKQDQWLAPIQGDDHRLGFLGLSEDEYLEVIDCTGRQLTAENKGSIPEHMKPILVRLEINAETWFENNAQFIKKFRRAAGTAEHLQEMAEKCGQTRYRGEPASREWFKVS